MNIVEAIILGIVQGLTEFLPVSSSGHLEIGSVLLGVEGQDNLLFSILVHGATALSTVVVFRKDIMILLKESLQFQLNDSTVYLFKILVSIIPVGIVGVLWKSEIEMFFGGKVIFVSAMLMITALLLFFTHYAKEKEGEITFVKAIVIGLAQTLAILPGISRSGATISTALLLGVDREKAARFSFLMVLVPILGATLLEVKDLLDMGVSSTGDTSVVTYIAGFLAAFFAGMIACKWMINLVKRGKLLYFALYCFIVGAVVMITYW